jgi:hypothetical protein
MGFLFNGLDRLERLDGLDRLDRLDGLVRLWLMVSDCCFLHSALCPQKFRIPHSTFRIQMSLSSAF